MMNLKKRISQLFITLVLLLNFPITVNGACSLVLDSTQHKTLVKKVIAHDFDDAKLSTIKNAIEKNCFTTKQVIELLKLLSFEEDKINIAKIAYAKVIDPANWDLLYDVFEFETSKKEVKDFIADSK